MHNTYHDIDGIIFNISSLQYTDTDECELMTLQLSLPCVEFVVGMIDDWFLVRMAVT